MEEKNSKYIGAILGTMLIIALLSIFSIFGGAIMKLFGFQYESVGSIILFFITVGALGFPIEMIAKGLPNALLSLDKINIVFAKILFIFLDSIATIITMKVVDYFMESVSATDISIFIIAVITAFIGIGDIHKKQLIEDNI